MALNPNIHKVLMIGSGPIVIGQAAEFDYAGTQACRALKEEGLDVVLVNSNPATIMTDSAMADHIYIEPLNLETVERIIEKEKPDSVLSTLGGQTGLTLSMELAKSGFLKSHNVRLLGADPTTIDKAEDRQMFKDTMEAIGEPVIPSKVVNTIEDAVSYADVIGYPVIVRPAFTLGGTGGGICNNEDELREISEAGLRLSPITQVLIEKGIAGWKEIEFEVMRDSKDNCITICSMENFDPVGIHTGDSIVIAPAVTLADKEYQMLRSAAINIWADGNVTELSRASERGITNSPRCCGECVLTLAHTINIGTHTRSILLYANAMPAGRVEILGQAIALLWLLFSVGKGYDFEVVIVRIDSSYAVVALVLI